MCASLNEECRSLYYATLASAKRQLPQKDICNAPLLQRLVLLLPRLPLLLVLLLPLSPKSFWLHLSNGSTALKYAKARKMFIISAVQTRDEDNGGVKERTL